MALDLRDLAFFLAVQRQGSFGRAATELMVTQPAVSERIRHLERVVGRALFERTARGAILTPAGTGLLPYAQRCAALADEALEAARSAEAGPALVLAVHSTFAQRVVPLVLGALGTTPWRVSIRDVHSEQVAPLLLDGVADLGVALSAGLPRGLARVALPTDPVVCAIADDHPLRRVGRISLSHFRASLVAVNAWGDGATEFLQRLGEAGVDDWRIRYCGDSATALALARDHAHVALVTESAVGSFRGVATVNLPGLAGWTVRLDALYRRGDRDSPLVKALTNRLRPSSQ